MPCETSDGQVVYVESGGPVRAGDLGGSLWAVSRKRSLKTRRALAAGPGGSYHSPARLADGRLLVSYRGANDAAYGLYLFDPRTGSRQSLIHNSAKWHEIDAASLAPRPEPAGRSSVVRDEAETGFLFCLDAYLSDRPAAKTIGDGRIKRLRVIKAVGELRIADWGLRIGGTGSDARDVADRGPVAEVVLGEVAVEKDGSFNLLVPARTPLRLETLGDDGRVLQAMSNWLWVMPREARGCIGCHEDRELTPPNRFVQAVRKEAQVVGAKQGDDD